MKILLKSFGLANFIKGGMMFSFLLQASCAPLMNDIVTDTEHPVALYRGETSIPYPPQFADRQKKAYPYISPLKTELSAEVVFQKVCHFVKTNFAWKNVTERPTEFHLQAVAVTRLLRFKDDIALQVRKTDSGSELHMRSRSRLGKGDFGVNAKRIKDFLKSFQEMLEESGSDAV